MVYLTACKHTVSHTMPWASQYVKGWVVRGAACTARHLYVVFQRISVSQLLQAFHSLTIRSNAGENEPIRLSNVSDLLDLRCNRGFVFNGVDCFQIAACAHATANLDKVVAKPSDCIFDAAHIACPIVQQVHCSETLAARSAAECSCP